MPLSKKINKPKANEDEIEELILKGGSSGEIKLNEEQDTTKRMQLRLSSKTISKIDALVKQRPGKVSRHTWIIEAIAEKLGKEESQDASSSISD